MYERTRDVRGGDMINAWSPLRGSSDNAARWVLDGNGAILPAVQCV